MAEFYDREKDASLGGDKKYDNFYLKLRHAVESYAGSGKGGAIAEYLLYLPDFFYLLVKLSTDKRVPRANRTQIIAAIAYCLSPLDVIPDILPGLGWVDDLYLALIVTDNLMNAVEIDVIEDYWPGDDDIVHFIKIALDRLNDKLGVGAISRILAKLSSAKEADDVVPSEADFDTYFEDK
ncbi:MAG: DUF1232 domain-containing protein [Oscillospiraceae bacterium]